MTYESTPKIILVVGATGAGKSHFVREVSGQEIQVGHNLNSCSQHTEEVCCDIAGQPVLILDTPGFDDTERSDFQVLTEVAESLARLYKDDFRVSGILYLHNILENRVRGSSLKNLQIFEKLLWRGFSPERSHAHESVGDDGRGPSAREGGRT